MDIVLHIFVDIVLRTLLFQMFSKSVYFHFTYHVVVRWLFPFIDESIFHLYLICFIHSTSSREIFFCSLFVDFMVSWFYITRTLRFLLRNMIILSFNEACIFDWQYIILNSRIFVNKFWRKIFSFTFKAVNVVNEIFIILNLIISK